MQFNPSFVTDVRIVFPLIKESLDSITNQNKTSLGLYGFCDEDILKLIELYPMSLIRKICDQYGWTRSQIIIRGLRTYV